MVLSNNTMAGKAAYSIHNNEDAMHIINQMEEAMFWVDKEGLVINANKASIDLLRIDSQKISEVSVFDIFSDITPMHWFAFAKSIVDSKDLHISATLKNRYGSDASVKVRFYAYQEHICVFVKKIVGDPVENEKVNRVAYEYDKLLYRLSHDLRSPILTLKGLINLTKKEADLSQTELLNLMEETVNKQCSLLSDIHHLSLLDTTDLSIDRINLAKVVNEIVEKSSKPDHAITWSFDFDLRDGFYSDEYFLKRLLSPVIQNAIDFSGRGNERAQIRISIESNNGNCYIVVEDNGEGIQRDIKSKVFEMFFKGSEHSKGSGLGLYLAKLAAKRLKSTITFIPKPNPGTVVRVRIPSS